MVVRMRHTRSHTKNRRSHHALKGARLSVEGGSSHPRHKALLDGTPYRGRSVMDTTVVRTARKNKNQAGAAAPAPKAEVKEEKKEVVKKEGEAEKAKKK